MNSRTYIVIGLLVLLAGPDAALSETAKRPSLSPSPVSPPAATPKKLTAAEQEKQEWIKRWCRRAKKDPKCKFYVEKELGRSMREIEKQDHQMGLDEYCVVHKDDFDCIARRAKVDAAERARRMKEFISFCRENSDAPRCEAGFDAEEMLQEEQNVKTKKKSGQ